MSYTPTIPPADPAAIPHYLTTELQALAQSLQQSQPYAYLQTLNVPPAKPREGLIAKADGTHWNPGSGAGVYCYIAGAWVFFGGGGGVGTVTHTSGALTAHAVIVGNGTADVKALAALGSSGNVLTSNGAGADPSFQAAAGGGITAGTGDVTFSGSGSVATTIALGVNHAWTSNQYDVPLTVADASTITVNAASRNNFSILLTLAIGSTRIFALPSNLQPGMTINWQFTQPSAGGCAVTFGAGVTFGPDGGDPAPILKTTGSSSARFSGIVQDDGTLRSVMIGQSGPQGAGYLASSTTSLATVGTGSVSFTTQAGLAYQFGTRLRATSIGTGDYMEGKVTAYAASVLTATMDRNSGTGTHSDWAISLAGDVGAAGAGGSSNFAGTSTTSNLLAAGSTTWATQASLAYNVGARVRVSSHASPSNYAEGICTAYAGTSITILVDTVGGSGTFAVWDLNISGNPGSAGAGGVATSWMTGSNGGDISCAATNAFTDLTGFSLSRAATIGQTLKLTLSTTIYSAVANWTPTVGFSVAGTDLGLQASDVSFGVASFAYPMTVIAYRTVIAGDISGGTVTVKVRCKGDGTHTAAMGNSSGVTPVFSIENLG